MKRLTYILSGMALVVLFQNCQQVTRFGSKDLGLNGIQGSVDAGSEIPVEDVVVDNGNGTTTPIVEVPPTRPPRMEDQEGEDETEEPKQEYSGTEEEPVDDEVESGSQQMVLCAIGSHASSPNSDVLLLEQGHGKSEGLCMSERACLTIVGRLYDTAAVFPGRGVCKGEKREHVSDAQVEDLISKLESALAE